MEARHGRRRTDCPRYSERNLPCMARSSIRKADLLIDAQQSLEPPRSMDARDPNDTVLALARIEPRKVHTLEELQRTLHQPRSSSHVSDDGDPGNAVIGLREWGGARTFPLHALSTDRSEAEGDHSEPDMEASGVRVVYEASLWRIRDWRGVAGLRQDGVPCREAVLTAGSEIALGGMTLVAESLRSMSLRQFCCRLIGWDGARHGDIDRALRAIRAAGLRRAPLALRGEGDLVLVAQALHRYTPGGNAQFIVVDPKRGVQSATVRSPASRANGIAAMREAAGGSLCIRAERPPIDFDAVLRAFREPDNSVQLLVCRRPAARDAWLSGAELIELPSLDSRTAELPRIITEYAADATALLDVPASCFLAVDSEWVSRMSARTLPDIEKGTLRMVAVRMSRNMEEAARILGMAPVSLSRWLARRSRDPKTGEPVRPPELRKAGRMLGE
jgi:hypothetical protein